jgi:hypothetical protein
MALRLEHSRSCMSATGVSWFAVCVNESPPTSYGTAPSSLRNGGCWRSIAKSIYGEPRP